MSNSSTDNKINAPQATVEEDTKAVEWDNVAVAMPFDMKTDVITVARRKRSTPSEWGRELFATALEAEGFPRWAEEIRKQGAAEAS